ncbi:MAG: hypothetical protein ACLGIC_08145 [Acidimicrobiia bacterium]
MAGLRDSAVGRAFIVAVVLATAWAAWSLTFRSYEAGRHHCEGAVPVLTWSEPKPPLDLNDSGTVSRTEMSIYREREAESPFGRIRGLDEVRNEACRDSLSEAGFWFRGLAPLLVIVGGAAAFRYVTTGRVRSASPQDPKDETVVR